jgi:hypothetical protein
MPEENGTGQVQRSINVQKIRYPGGDGIVPSVPVYPRGGVMQMMRQNEFVATLSW